MPQPDNKESVQLLKLEKLAKKLIRKSLKNNTLDYTVQLTVSSLEPSKIKYAAQISSPEKGVQPITFVFDNYKTLEASLEEAIKELNPIKVEEAFHENRINTYKNKIQQHEARLTIIRDPEFTGDEVDEDGTVIPMEQV
jgi:poly-D-alanine transfer protein DltD